MQSLDLILQLVLALLQALDPRLQILDLRTDLLNCTQCPRLHSHPQYLAQGILPVCLNQLPLVANLRVSLSPRTLSSESVVLLQINIESLNDFFEDDLNLSINFIHLPVGLLHSL